MKRGGKRTKISARERETGKEGQLEEIKSIGSAVRATFCILRYEKSF